jgi:phosphotriesterase-related protein
MEPQVPQPLVMTVTGPVAPATLGLTDAHTHTWIEPVPGAAPDLPRLNDQFAIAAELIEFRESGGGALVDCQPGGCGRNGQMMQELSRFSGVRIVACTGFHLKKYYPPDYWLYRPHLEPDDVRVYFGREINEGLVETRDQPQPVRAGFIKIACEAKLADTPAALIEAAAQAGIQTGVAIEVHTEQGSEAEKIAARFAQHGFPLNRLIICHIDKRPDLGLHCELARQGVTLEYDTFYRPKYQPDKHVWPLLEQMVAAGLEQQIVLATDMADAAMWSRLGGRPGQTAFTGQIMARLQAIGFEATTIQRLMGGNIAGRLAYPVTHSNSQ